MKNTLFAVQRPSHGLFFVLVLSVLTASCGGGGSGSAQSTVGSSSLSAMTLSSSTPSSMSANATAATNEIANTSPDTVASVTGKTATVDANTGTATSPADTSAAATTAASGASTTVAATTSGDTTKEAAPVATTSLMPYVNVAAIPASAVGYSTDQVQATSEIAPDSDIGAFRTTCDFSHMAFDDPIVFPGQPGKSHLHVFFGNTGANAYSTTDSLANTGNSTCRGGTVNRTAYWVPAIIDTTDGSPIKPDSVGVYYKTGYSGVKPEDVQPVPAGLRMIAGDSSASADSDLPWHFGCDGGSYNNQKYIPDCTLGDDHNLFVIINFPQCWDGVNLDSPDHKSHMAYADLSTSGCPADHPVALPAITYNIWYAIPVGTVLANWRLSSDNYSGRGGYSFHADWFGGWKRDVMESFVKNCLNAKKDCHSHLLGDGRMIY